MDDVGLLVGEGGGAFGGGQLLFQDEGEALGALLVSSGSGLTLNDRKKQLLFITCLQIF